MESNALYYPFIDFRSSHIIKSLSLLHDRVYRIVPEGIIPDDVDELAPLLEDGSIGGKIDPKPYAPDAASNFLIKLEDWDAAALAYQESEKESFSRIHSDKVDERINDLFQEIGYKLTDKWYHIPTELASNYMLYLARDIGKRNKLTLVTPEWAPWTAVTYFNIDGRLDDLFLPYGFPDDESVAQYALFSLFLRNTVPANIEEIPAESIRTFRLKRKDEIRHLRNSVNNLLNELQSLEDPQVRVDKIYDAINAHNQAMQDYQKSADILNVKGWLGAILMGFPAPISLGELFNLPSATIVTLAICGIALGGIFNILNTANELRKLKVENPISCLIELRKSVNSYTSQRGGGMNFMAYNCMEEYVND